MDPTFEEYLSWYTDQMSEDINNNSFSFQSGMALKAIEGSDNLLVKAKLDHAFDSFMSRLDKFTASGYQSSIDIPHCESLLEDTQSINHPHQSHFYDHHINHSMTDSIHFINDISFAIPIIIKERVEVPVAHAPSSSSSGNAPPHHQSKVAKTNNTYPSAQPHGPSSHLTSSSSNGSLNKGRVSPPQSVYDLSEDTEDEYSIPNNKAPRTTTPAPIFAPPAPPVKPNPFQSAKDQYVKEVSSSSSNNYF